MSLFRSIEHEDAFRKVLWNILEAWTPETTSGRNEAVTEIIGRVRALEPEQPSNKPRLDEETVELLSDLRDVFLNYEKLHLDKQTEAGDRKAFENYKQVVKITRFFEKKA